ncbi:MAG: hypothetical protein AAGF84_03730 [Planctomycetota bacterium]
MFSPAEFSGPRFTPVGFRPNRPNDASRIEVLRRDTAQGADTLVETLPANATQTLVTGPSNTDRNIRTRRFNACGLGDLDDARVRQQRLAFDGDGNLILPAANGPIDLQLVAGPAGLVTARWRYRRTRTLPVAVEWRAYVATDADPMSLVTPTATRTGSARGRLQLSLGTFTHDTLVRAVVVSVTDQGVVCPVGDEASVTADAQAPTAPSVSSVAVEAGRFG